MITFLMSPAGIQPGHEGIWGGGGGGWNQDTESGIIVYVTRWGLS